MKSVSDQTANANGTNFSQIVDMVLDYKNPEFELDPIRLNFIHDEPSHGTEI